MYIKWGEAKLLRISKADPPIISATVKPAAS
jgi:hypothetical protein